MGSASAACPRLPGRLRRTPRWGDRLAKYEDEGWGERWRKSELHSFVSGFRLLGTNSVLGGEFCVFYSQVNLISLERPKR